VHVGISFTAHSRAVGGGFTFLQTILSGIQAAHGGHRWTLVGSDPRAPEFLTAPMVGFLSLHRHPWSRRFDAIHDAADRLWHQMRHIQPLEQTPRQRAFVDQALRRHGIELLWSLTPEPLSTELPFVTTVWDLQHRLQPWFPEVSANGAWRDRERMFSTVLPRAAAIVVGTERGREEVHNFYGIPRERIWVVPFPTPGLPHTDSTSDPAILAIHGLSPGYVFYPAQFWAHKNHVNLLHAIRLLHAAGKPLRLVCTGGDGGNLDHVSTTIRELGLTESVSLLGFVPAEHLPSLYRGAACLCFPSFFGPDNLPPLEAMAHGCPVVAADVPGAAEQLSDAALLFDPASPSAIAQTIRAVVDDPGERQRLKERGELRARGLTPAAYVQEVSRLLTQFESYRRCWRSSC
jgi:glycosyltransferase involved in cell wall biosynthesis